MFYDRYVQLCEKKHISPTRAAIEAGFSKSLVSKWKSEKTKEPSPDIVRKLANYFGMPPYAVLEDYQINYVENWEQDIWEDWNNAKTDDEKRRILLKCGVPRELESDAMQIFEQNKSSTSEDTDAELMFALFGTHDGIDDALYEDVKSYARFKLMQRKAQEKKGK